MILLAFFLSQRVVNGVLSAFCRSEALAQSEMTLGQVGALRRLDGLPMLQVCGDEGNHRMDRTRPQVEAPVPPVMCEIGCATDDATDELERLRSELEALKELKPQKVYAEKGVPCSEDEAESSIPEADTPLALMDKDDGKMVAGGRLLLFWNHCSASKQNQQFGLLPFWPLVFQEEFSDDLDEATKQRLEAHRWSFYSTWPMANQLFRPSWLHSLHIIMDTVGMTKILVIPIPLRIKKTFSWRRLLEVWLPRATWKAKNLVKEVGWSRFHTSW